MSYDNPWFFIINANEADISKVMYGINQCYAQYFNFRHKRHGHVFQDKFKSKVVDSEGYLFTLCAYIHNNPTDIEGYEACPELFKYSTSEVYLGLKSNEYGITDECFIMGFFSGDVLIRCYCDFTYKQICELLGRLTLTRISELNEIGLGLIDGMKGIKRL